VPIQVATQASLPTGSASTHPDGAIASLTTRPPAATRASAWSWGTQISRWIRLRWRRGGGEQPHEHAVQPQVDVGSVVVQAGELGDGLHEAGSGGERPGGEEGAGPAVRDPPVSTPLEKWNCRAVIGSVMC
jgi:hypothetical protein